MCWRLFFMSVLQYLVGACPKLIKMFDLLQVSNKNSWEKSQSFGSAKWMLSRLGEFDRDGSRQVFAKTRRDETLDSGRDKFRDRLRDRKDALWDNSRIWNLNDIQNETISRQEFFYRDKTRLYSNQIYETRRDETRILVSSRLAEKWDEKWNLCLRNRLL